MKKFWLGVTLAALLLGSTNVSAQDRSFICLVKPRMETDLGAPVAGVLDELAVDRGDVVEAGQPVAYLKRDVEKANLELARVKAANDSAIKRRRAELSTKRNILRRKRQLIESKYVSQETLEKARLEVDVAQQMLDQAKTDAKLAKLQVRRAQAMLDLRIVKSPIDGVITEIQGAPGQYVSEQGSIMTIASIDPLHVEVYLPLERYGEVKVDDVLDVRLKQPIGTTRRAKVTVVDPVIDAASDTFGVRLNLPNSDRKIPAGSRCNVVFDRSSSIEMESSQSAKKD